MMLAFALKVLNNASHFILHILSNTLCNAKRLTEKLQGHASFHQYQALIANDIKLMVIRFDTRQLKSKKKKFK